MPVTQGLAEGLYEVHLLWIGRKKKYYTYYWPAEDQWGYRSTDSEASYNARNTCKERHLPTDIEVLRLVRAADGRIVNGSVGHVSAKGRKVLLCR